jgi:transcriptional regulator with XRE-family HTH domain
MHQVLQNIRALRDIKRFSQEHMADNLKITQSSYARFESGGAKVDYRLIERVAEVLDMDVESIINFHIHGFYKGKSERDELEDQPENYRMMAKDMNLLKEKIKHLEAMIDGLTHQIQDKNEIIELLKAQK